MKVISLLSLFSAATLAHPSGLWWGTDQCYSVPENTDNYCLEDQKAGFDWSDLANGDNWSPEGFNFVGFSPKSHCQAAGNGNCIGGKLSREDNWTLRVDSDIAPFSVSDFHLATSRATDVLITYTLADGSACHQVATSTPEGLDIHNDQCGGATSVEFRLPEESKFGECDMDIHRIHFDCSTGPKPPPTPPTSTPGHTKTCTTTEVDVQTSTSTETLVLVPTTSTAWTTVVEVHTFTSIETPVLTTSTVWTTEEVTVTKCPPAVTECPPHSTVTLTSTYSLSTTVCPVTLTTPGPQTTTITRTIPVTLIPVATPSATPSSCPDVVPKCINTWLTVPKCDSNSDSGCFCPSSAFTEKVKSCITAWGSSQEEIQSGLSYFAGICAPYVPSNPAIIDIVPTSTCSSQTNESTGPPTATITAPPPPPTDIPCTTITWSSKTVTVPVVSFSTITLLSTTTVSLLPVTTTVTSCTTTPWASETVTVPETSPSSTSPCTTSTTLRMTTRTPSLTTATTCTGTPTEAVVTGTGPVVITSNDGSRSVSPSIWVLSVTFLLLFLH
ncbi:hypothetical protein N7510_005461 [Penicillium lagena]|uniref:uncharacterized protein n=1 Tax=Penicillium lagena TaxID=94218 RepID=UPI00254134A2|nr:uncharacterized protein N7510_005461 [Penicillium lagena]KAJ5612267.1 hypothetical protein N7510_005461 [Penicillium lagena]